MAGCVTVKRPEDYSTGCPPKYDPTWMPDKAVAVLQGGGTINKVALALDCMPSTVYEWANKYSEFSDAIARGRLGGQVKWEDEGQDNLKDARYNTNMYKFQMSNRYGWADKQERKTTVDINLTVDSPALTAEIFDSLPDYAKPLQLQDVTPTVIVDKTEDKDQS